jgi:cytochrome c biogenesis protein CcmG, thiol:disulfide interchange protein DsbE
MRRYLSIIISLLFVTTLLTSCSSNSNLPFNQGLVPSCAGINTSGISTNELLLDCLDGSGAVNFYSIKGPIVVNVWGSWCEGCRQEMPYFVELYQNELFKNGEIKLIGIDIEESSRQVGINFIKAYGKSWPHLEDLAGKTKILFGPGAPVTWFIDKDGKVVNKHIGAYTDRDQLFTQVEKAFGVKL